MMDGSKIKGCMQRGGHCLQIQGIDCIVKTHRWCSPCEVKLEPDLLVQLIHCAHKVELDLCFAQEGGGCTYVFEVASHGAQGVRVLQGSMAKKNQLFDLCFA